VNGVGGIISQSFATGNALSIGHGFGAGGLAGTNAGLITQSYATGPVKFNPDYCGGLGRQCYTNGGGLVFSNSGTIEQSFATGAVTPRIESLPPPAGITNSNRGVIATDVFWDVAMTGATIGVANGTQVPAMKGLTTAQMSQPASFGPTYDFSPQGTWAMPPGATHPVLLWELAH
jgi:hypothetical protein